MTRTYLDYNATAPLRDEARAAMIEAMDLVGNPSSVHAEGRKAKALLEKCRREIAQTLGADGADLIFTSGATEAAALALAGRGLHSSKLEHAAVLGWVNPSLQVIDGKVRIQDPAKSVIQLANSETGLLQDISGAAVSDVTQGFGRVPFSYHWSGVEMAFLAAHKFGGPKGIGALVIPTGYDLPAQIRGGGQEMSRRSGTENLVAIAGFAAAAKAAQDDLSQGLWEKVEKLRDLLEQSIEEIAPEVICVSKDLPRLANTSCFVVPGWKGETQVMLMDLAGFSVSAGSACSSGKVKASGVLEALGYDAHEASSALRVSLGPDTCEDDVLRFVKAWGAAYEKWKASAAA